MPSSVRALIAPAYLFVCLLLGGSAQGIWQNMILELLGLAIIGWCAWDKRGDQFSSETRQLFFLAAAFVVLVALQAIPLPSAIWAHLGPRENIAAGFRTLGLPAPAEPLSLTPAASLDSLFMIIPSLAIVCAMVGLKAYRRRWLAIALILGTVAGIALGALQVGSSNPDASSWYLYEDTNVGKAVGFFANADHMATLLLVTIPFVAAIVAAGRRTGVQRYSAIVAIAAAIAMVLLAGIALNGSLAGYGLALPVIAASALIIVPRKGQLRTWIISIAAVLLIVSVAALETTPIGTGKIGEHAKSAVQSRSEILSTTARAAGQFMPFGSGLGSFRRVYPLYESPGQVTPVYVVHAHNDLIEFVLELGLAGLVLVLLFLAWWGSAVWKVWRSGELRPFARAASIASGAILVHSLVDFPLRTAAIGACFGMCLALLADRRGVPAEKEQAELRSSRHVVI
jgi:O-antigen ligase